MAKINLLSQETIDKIAAGEVVERPASVAKELIENAIDAGATAISIEIKNGGIEYLRITDNGSGIAKEDIPLAFLRHSTSKIIDAKDLMDVKSLGFRGEALSSISAVARVELITKTADALMGSDYVIEGGSEISFTDIGAPDGTTFIIRQLFYNTPARRKFLKAESTEGSLVYDVVEHLALSHPEISFKFIMNGKEKLMTSGNGSLSDNIYQIYGRQIASNILNINYEDDSMHIHGFIGQSVIARGNRAFEHFFINNRYIKSNNLSKACEEGYYGFLMGHQFPFFVINLDFKSSFVDVNVHPTKQEVRFENEHLICELLTKTINNRLLNREDVIESTVDKDESKTPFIIEKVAAEPFEKNRLNAIKANIVEQIKKDSPYEKKFATNNIYQAPVNNVSKERPVSLVNKDIPNHDSNFSFEEDGPNQEKTTDLKDLVQPKDDKAASSEAQASFTKPTQVKYEQLSFLSKEAQKDHKIIGQVFDTYWIIEYDGKMYIIDQHAAHEKVLFEKTMARLKNNEMTTQQISPAIIISLSNQDLLLFEKYRSAFEKIGFEIDSFGGNELSITGIPGNFLNLNPKDLFLELLSDCDTYKASDSFDIIIERVASMSCKAAVKGNNKLSVSEIKQLINDLLSCDNPYHCPHGRPTMISFSEYELAKKFKRIV